MFDEDHDEAPDPLRGALEKPLRQQAVTIAHLAQAQALISSLPETAEPDNESEEALNYHLFGSVSGCVLRNAWLLGPKLANACSSTDFGHRLEMAVLIKRAACELQMQASFLATLAVVPAEYLAALHDEVAVFRALFVPWVAAFDPSDHYDDGWGLFAQLLPPQP